MNGTSLATLTRPGSAGAVGVGEGDGAGGGDDGAVGVGETDGLGDGVGVSIGETEGLGVAVDVGTDGAAGVGWGATLGGGAELHAADTRHIVTVTSTSLSHPPIDNLRTLSNASRRPEPVPSRRMVPTAS